MPGNYKNSKESRREIYDYVELLLERKLKEHEAITLSQLVRKSIHVQNQSLIVEDNQIKKTIHHLRQRHEHKINSLLKITNYVIDKQRS